MRCPRLVLAVLLVAPLYAIQREVPAQYPTLDGAIDASQSGDTVNVAPGSYQADDLTILHDLVLRCADPAGRVELSGNGNALLWIYRCDNGVVVDGFTFRNDHQNGLIVRDGYASVVRNCTFQESSGSSSMVAIEQGAGVLIQDCEFLGNEDGSGAAIAGTGELMLLRCNLAGFLLDNLLTGVIDHAGAHPVRLLDCTFTGNRGTERVGELVSSETGAELVDCRIRGNRCGQLLDTGAPLILDGCDVADNQTEQILLRSADLELRDCRLHHNSCSGSGATLLGGEGGAVELVASTLWGNEVSGSLLGAGETTLERSVLVANRCRALAGEPPSTVTCTLLYGNLAGDWSGPFAAFAGQAGNLEEDPRLVDPEHGDLRPASLSPLRPENNACAQLLGGAAPADLPAHPWAFFRGDRRNGARPVAVTFTASDQTQATQWEWDFTGDGIADANGPQASWTFAERGVHPVRLSVQGPEGSAEWTDSTAVTAAGDVLRIPEDYPDVTSALAAWLPLDTLDLAPGEWGVEAYQLLPGGVVLRGRGENQSTRLQLPNAYTEATGEGRIRFENVAFAPVAEHNFYGGSCSWELDHCRVETGAAFITQSGSFRADHCVFDQSQGAYGGYQDDARFTDCLFLGGGNLLDASGCMVSFKRVTLLGTTRMFFEQNGVSQTRLLLENCTLIDCPTSLFAGLFYQSNLTLDSCLIVGTDPQILPPDSYHEITVDDIRTTDIWVPGQTPWSWPPLQAFAGQNGNLEVDPHFCAPGQQDHHLSQDSPCVLDAGAGAVMGAWPVGCATPVPYPRFAASGRDGAAPFLVYFRSQTLGPVAVLQWDVDGDGETEGTGETFQWTYSQPGVYPVILRVVTEDGIVNSDTLLIRAGGRTLRVPEEYTDLALALSEATVADTVRVAAGTHTASGLTLRAGVRMEGPAGEGEPLAILSGEEGLGELQIQGSADRPTRLSRLVFRGGAYALRDGSPYNENNQVHVTDCVFEDHQGVDSRGVVDIGYSTAALQNCRFSRNTNPLGGPHILRTGVVRDCLFEDNSGNHSGGLRAQRELEVRNCRFLRNRSGWRGGAITLGLNTEGSWIDSCLFADNRASQGSSIYTPQQALVRNSTFVGDSAASGSGAIQANGSGTQLGQVLITHQIQGLPVVAPSVSSVNCCDVWGNTIGNYIGALQGHNGANGNVSLDPLYCDRSQGDYSLQDTSPINAAHSACGGVGGVFGPCQGTGLDEPAGQPATFALSPAVPNPFNPLTTLAFELPAAGQARLTVFNLAGQEVARLVDGELPAGAQRRVLDGSGLASGVYFARLDFQQHSQTQKLLLVK